ncbi:MAG: hypothetical protein K0S32_461 [Bacteroidetes bacterium]|jgi:hypothetical protein|nr:hypothetical protein [Bacteroidota bacterium]
MESPWKILQQFEPITLKEMDGVKLMNRTDTKFVFSISSFEQIMSEVREHYKVLEIEGNRLCRYETLYYDTHNYDLYYQHHKGKLNRYKIRHRTYVESHTGFLEVKFKNNKGRTIKTRISKADVPYTWEEESELFLSKTLPFKPQILEPVLWINYNRYTLVNKSGAERVTIDLGLEFIKDENKQTFDRLVIAEVKQDKRKASPFMTVMKKHHIREGSISKYCMGIAVTCNGVKRNNFKSKLSTIKHKNLC